MRFESDATTNHLFLLLAVCLTSLAIFGPVHAEDEPYEPNIAPASGEGEQAIGSFRAPEGFDIRLVAAEPDLANPVAFGIDEQGRFYVCETFRQGVGVEDNRKHMYWLTDDLSAQSVEDRRQYIIKHHKEDLARYTREQDRIRLLSDTDGDGLVDKSTVFADGFNDVVDGTGAGVLALDGDVYYTCIPKLWKFRDDNGDGRADEREVLQDGFGVRFAFRGHDMHGLTLGPDGRIYFSIGDRGYNLLTADGRTIKRPGTGAVFRCERDGSNLEEFAYGLRNPQELAFDDYGNLFTGDNNSDSGDKARWVYICEGSDSGWRMYYQYLNDRGPWNRERMWYPYRSDDETTAKQPAFIVPPITNISDGPSGLVAYYGVGLPESYDGHFFLADFRGQADRSGIRSFANKANGAGFELVDSQEYLWQTLVTDVDFGYDGQLYYSDWVNSWEGVGKGRIYRSEPQDEALVKAGAEVAAIFAEGFKERSNEQLVEFLSHADRRVRQRSQMELADRGELNRLIAVLNGEADELAKVHALWGLWQLGRQTGTPAAGKALQVVAEQLSSRDDELVAQACNILGDCGYKSAASKVADLLQHDDARVQYFAALAVGKLGYAEAIPGLLTLASKNNNEDPWLRHAIATGLAGAAKAGSVSELVEAAQKSSPAARLATVVALRQLESPEVAAFLRDGDPAVIVETARAIHDARIQSAYPQLAALPVRADQSEALIRRVMNANFVLGGEENAKRVVELAAMTNLDDKLRTEAVEELLAWETPPVLDRVTNQYRELQSRKAEFLRALVQPYLGGLMNSPQKLQGKVIELAADLGIDDIQPELKRIVTNAEKPVELRISALRALDAIAPEESDEIVKAQLEASEAGLRATARELLIRRQPELAVELLELALEDGTLSEQQQAARLLGELKSEPARELLLAWIQKLLAGDVPAGLQLDLILAGEQNGSEKIKEALAVYTARRDTTNPLAAYEECLEGGDAGKGAEIFFGRADASCLRCHAVNGQGGGVGPDLSEVGKKYDRRYLLESLLVPDAKIAKGFETVLVVTIEGKIISGIIREETDEQLTLVQPLGDIVTIAQDDIDDRAPGKSGMPADFAKQLSKTEIRDLIEYLKSLQEKQDSGHGEGV